VPKPPTIPLLPFEVLWRCDGCGMEQITPRDDPPAKCPRCQHPSVFWVASGDA
jgi:rubrerythrin